MKTRGITKNISLASFLLLLFGLLLAGLGQAILELSLLPFLFTRVVAGAGF